MCCNIKITELPNNIWELKSPKSQRDLIIKKIALAIIAALNLAVLAGALYLIITYCPFPAEALLASPFIVGILAALAYLKFPTFGINSINYSQYSNPATIAGKLLTYTFFGPYMYVAKKCDWTAYHDPHIANKIANDLNTRTFEELAKEYGKHFGNFAEYGIIPTGFKEDLLNLYNKYCPIENAISFYKKQGTEWHENVQGFEAQKRDIEGKWGDLRQQISPHLVFPKIPEEDFSSPLTGWRHTFLEFFHSAPFEEKKSPS